MSLVERVFRLLYGLVWFPSYLFARRALSAIPPVFVSRLCQHAKQFLPLDYPKSPILLQVDSETAFARLSSCKKEPETVRWLQTSLRPGEVIYDIGANVGAYSLIAGTIVGASGRVVAVEPVSSNFNALCQNILENRLNTSIIPLCVALGSHSAIAALTLSSRLTGAASHSMRHLDSTASATTGKLAESGIYMPCMTLDKIIEMLGLPAPHAIKIDVDGAELEVLRGALATLKSPSLRSLLVEIDSSTGAADDILALLKEAGWYSKEVHPRNAPGVYNHILTRLS